MLACRFDDSTDRKCSAVLPVFRIYRMRTICLQAILCCSGNCVRQVTAAIKQAGGNYIRQAKYLLRPMAIDFGHTELAKLHMQRPEENFRPGRYSWPSWAP